jgi:hypothetical protein
MRSILKSIASNDKKTTVLGIVAGALLAAQIDFGALINGDSTAIGQAAGVVVATLIGYYTNKPDRAKTEQQ